MALNKAWRDRAGSGTQYEADSTAPSDNTPVDAAGMRDLEDRAAAAITAAVAAEATTRATNDTALNAAFAAGLTGRAPLSTDVGDAGKAIDAHSGAPLSLPVQTLTPTGNVTSDTAAIEQAIIDGRRIEGAFVVDGSLGYSDRCLTMPENGLLSGMGPGRASITLANGVNKDLLRTTNFATLTGLSSGVANIDAMPHTFAIEGVRFDGNFLNNAAGGCIKIVGYAYRVRDIEISRFRGLGFYSEQIIPWTEDPTVDLEGAGPLARINDLKIHSCVAGGYEFHGPSDSVVSGVECYNNGPIDSTGYPVESPASTTVGIYVNAPGYKGTSHHSWGRAQKYAYDYGPRCSLSYIGGGSHAEGAQVAQVKMRGADSRFEGGIYHDPSTTAAGVEMGAAEVASGTLTNGSKNVTGWTGSRPRPGQAITGTGITNTDYVAASPAPTATTFTLVTTAATVSGVQSLTLLTTAAACTIDASFANCEGGAVRMVYEDGNKYVIRGAQATGQIFKGTTTQPTLGGNSDYDAFWYGAATLGDVGLYARNMRPAAYVPPTPAKANVLRDTFTIPSATAAGQLLTAHEPEVGPAWANYFQGFQIDAAGRVRATAAVAITYNNVAPPTAEYDVEADFVFLTKLAGEEMAITARMSSAAETFYRVVWFADFEVFAIYKSVAGVQTNLVQFSYPYPGDKTVRRVRFQVRDAKKTMFLDGAEFISTTDNAITAVGHPGIVRYSGGAAPTDSTGIHLDNYAVTPA